MQPISLAGGVALAVVAQVFAGAGVQAGVQAGAQAGAPSGVFGPSAPAHAWAHEDAVQAVWSTLDERWNERDVDGFSALFTKDGHFRFVDRRESLDGRRAIHRSFSERFPTFAPTIRHRTTLQDVRAVVPDVRAVDGVVEILRLEAEPGEATVINTFWIFSVMLRTPEGWRIHQLRAYELPTPAEP